MIKIDAKHKEDGQIECTYEVELECSHCGMTVDAEEYESGTCNDCGEDWEEKRHTAIHVTSIPMQGQSS